MVQDPGTKILKLLFKMFILVQFLHDFKVVLLSVVLNVLLGSTA
jgi:hypothetical protein